MTLPEKATQNPSFDDPLTYRSKNFDFTYLQKKW